MNRIRLATWADASAFKRALSELERQLVDFQGNRRELVAANWAELKAIGRK